MKRNLRIGVFMGGTSAEREVSLNSGKAVSAGLKKLSYDVVDIDADAAVCGIINDEKIDLAFLVLHGGTGEDGSIQGMLEVMGIPYTGSGVLASAIAMDKLISKTLFAEAGLNIAAQTVVSSLEDKVDMKLPVVVKPAQEGSSIGVSIVSKSDELEPAIKHALKQGGVVMVESFIKGKEVQIGVLGNRALGGVEVRPKNEFYDYEAKYTVGMTEYILPPEIDDELYAKAKDAGLKAHQAIKCAGASRVDLIIEDSTNDIYVLEVNTIPGMTETSLLPKIAKLAGYEFTDLLEAMVRDALTDGEA